MQRFLVKKLCLRKPTVFSSKLLFCNDFFAKRQGCAAQRTRSNEHMASISNLRVFTKSPNSLQVKIEPRSNRKQNGEFENFENVCVPLTSIKQTILPPTVRFCLLVWIDCKATETAAATNNNNAKKKKTFTFRAWRHQRYGSFFGLHTQSTQGMSGGWRVW